MRAMSDGSIDYRVCPFRPGAHLFEVECHVPDPDPDGQLLRMPAWIPGSYMIRDFAKNVVAIEAHCEGRPLVLERVDKSTWRTSPCPGPLAVRCEVYAWDLSVRGAHLDTTHAYFNGACLFLEVVGKSDRRCRVEIQPPPGGRYVNWRLATSMPREDAPPYDFGGYRASDYAELIDHPVEMGEFTLASFEAGGVPHDITLTGQHHADMARLCRDLEPVCEQHIRLFGPPPPAERYLFLVQVVGEGYGGLEHRASSSLLCSRNDLPVSGDAEVSEGYRRFLGLCSHEYFHSWNIKRIRPAAFAPYDLSQEVHTSLLWAFEGITSYYDDLALVRSAVVSREDYLELLGQTITRVLRGPGRHRQTVSDSSFDAWTKFYKADENAPTAIVSYYAKGSLIALALDMLIRRETGGERSLDDVMRELWSRYGQTDVGVPEDGIEAIVGEVTHRSLADFFDLALRSTQDLPLAELLATVGVTMSLRPATDQNDKGGKVVEQPPPRSWLGARTSADAQGARLDAVLDGGPAQSAGLATGDVVIALDGLRVGAEDIDKRIAAYASGARVEVHAFRRDELMRFELETAAPPFDTCVLSFAAELDSRTAALRDAWLTG
jgi:predicted metalloprotease with PDZ domain